MESHFTLGASILKVTPLHRAVRNNNAELAKILIEAGAYVDLQQYNLDPPSKKMRVILVNYPSHLAREREIWKIWSESDEDKTLSIQNNEKATENNDKGKEEILPKTSEVSLSDKSPAFFFNYTHVIQWLPEEALRDTLDLVEFPKVGQERNNWRK
ncbi:MAG: Ankyrin repeat [Gammaproteobacteria bacterium]|jgi:hypothetical protein|nr:Ankyrin repeat [Gammaproteobacteria bacterium]